MEYMALKKPIVQFDLAEGRFSAEEASLYVTHNNTVEFAEKISMLLVIRSQCSKKFWKIGAVVRHLKSLLQILTVLSLQRRTALRLTLRLMY